MPAEMGTFRVDVELENPARPGARAVVPNVLVDTGAELSWMPAAILESLGVEPRKHWRFRQADGSILERWAGWAAIYLAGTSTVDEIVFGEPGDLILLGARSLEGMNLRVDPFNKALVDAGPAPAAATGGLAGAHPRLPPASRSLRATGKRTVIPPVWAGCTSSRRVASSEEGRGCHPEAEGRGGRSQPNEQQTGGRGAISCPRAYPSSAPPQ